VARAVDQPSWRDPHSGYVRRNVSPSGVGSQIQIAYLLVLIFAVAVAVLRYRLYEIDRLISRTLAYTIVTGLLIAAYLALAAMAHTVVPLRSPFAVALATLAAAAVFNPLRRRVQRAVVVPDRHRLVGSGSAGLCHRGADDVLQERGERPSSQFLGEAAFGERGEAALADGQCVGPDRQPADEERKHIGMGIEESAIRERDPLERLPPASRASRLRVVGAHDLAHPRVEHVDHQLVLAGDMAVEGGRPGLQPFGQQTHVHAIDSELVDEVGRDGDDLLEAPGWPASSTFRRRHRSRAPPGRAPGWRSGVSGTACGLAHHVDRIAGYLAWA